jgi:capsular polysaccharide biosynthesis protein
MNENVGTQVAEEDTIDLLQLLNALWKRLWIIVTLAIAGGFIALLGTYFFVTPTYTSTAMLYVNNSSVSVGSTKIDLSDLTASQGLVDTYMVILNSRTTLEQIIERSGVDYTYTQLGNMISTSTVDDTEVFSVSVTSTDAEEAALIANTIVEVLPERIKDILDGSAVKTVDSAIVPTTKTSPSYSKNTLIGMMLVAVICCAVIIIRDMLDTTIHSEDYLLKTYTDIPLLTIVPDISGNIE